MNIEQLIGLIQAHIDSIDVHDEKNTLDYKLYCLDAMTALYRAKMGFNYLTGKRR